MIAKTTVALLARFPCVMLCDHIYESFYLWSKDAKASHATVIVVAIFANFNLVSIDAL
jgi:hypothetical protein